MCRRAVFCITIVIISSFVSQSHERALVGGETTLLTQNEIPTGVAENENEVITSLNDEGGKGTKDDQGFGKESEALHVDVRSEKENFENLTENLFKDQNSVAGEEITTEGALSIANSGEVIERVEIKNASTSESVEIAKDIPDDSVTHKSGLAEAKTTHNGESLLNKKKLVPVSTGKSSEDNTIQFPEKLVTPTDSEVHPRMLEITETPTITGTKYVEETNLDASTLSIKEEHSNLSTEAASVKNEAVEIENAEKFSGVSNSINHAESIELTAEQPIFANLDTDSALTIDLPIYEKGANEIVDATERVEPVTLSNEQEPKAHRADLLSLEEVSEVSGEASGDGSVKNEVQTNINIERNTTQAGTFDLRHPNPISNTANSTANPKQAQPQTSTQLKQDQAPGAWYSNIVALFPTYVLNPFNYFSSTPAPWNYTSLLNYSSLNFTNLLRSQQPTDGTSTATTQQNSTRNITSNLTQLHLIPYFRIFKIIPYNASMPATEHTSTSPNTSKASQHQLASDGTKDDQQALSIRFQTQNIRQIWPYYRYQGNQLGAPLVTYIEMQPSQSYNYPSYSVHPSQQQLAPANVGVQQTPLFNQGGKPIIEIDESQATQKLNKTTTLVGNTPKKTTSTSLMVEMVMPSPILKFMKNIYNLFVTNTN